MDELRLSCACGSLSGRLSDPSPSTGMRLICMCDDCQAFARWLGRDDVLDENGGTEVYQVAPNRVMLDDTKKLGLLRLSPKGLHRWYATCCRTPLGNTMSASWPFIGINRSMMPDEDLDSILGPVREAVQARFGKGEMPSYARKRVSPGLAFGVAKQLAVWKLRGGTKPSPVFNEDGRPKVRAHVLPLEERRALY